MPVSAWRSADACACSMAGSCPSPSRTAPSLPA